MAEVKFKRIESSSNINSVPIVDGQIIYTKDGKTYLDYEGQRVVINGTPETTMSDSSTNAVANSTVKNYVDTNIETVNNKIHNGTILWTNPYPRNGFSSQTITLNSDDYDLLEIIYMEFNSNNQVGSIKIYKGCNTRLITALGSGTTYTRSYEYVSDTSYSIGSTTNGGGNDNLYPLYIIGYKTGLFE